MSDEQTPAPEAGDEVVQAEEKVTPEAAESTEGQEKDPPAEVDGEKPEAEEEPSPSKVRRERRKAEVQRLRDEAKTANAEVERLQEQLAEYERRENDPAPREADYEDYAEYQAALAAHKSMQALDGREKERLNAERERRNAEIEENNQRQQRENAQNWASMVDEAKARYADFDKVVYAPDVPFTAEMSEILVTSDLGADVAYHLASDRAKAAQIAAMPPLEQAREMGRIEAMLSLPQARSQTQAPEPVTPVGGKAKPVSKDPDDMSMPEYIAWRQGKS